MLLRGMSFILERKAKACCCVEVGVVSLRSIAAARLEKQQSKNRYMILDTVLVFLFSMQ